MRILIAAHGFPPTHSAGAERRAERMAQWLVANHHEVEVFTIEKLDDTGFRMESSFQDGYKVHRLYYDLNEGEDVFRNLYDYRPIGEALRRVLSQQSFDLVHMVSGYLLGNQVIQTAHQLGLPIIVTLTEYWFMCARLNLIQATQQLCNGPEHVDKCVRCLMEYKRRYRLPAQTSPRLMDMFWTLVHRTSITSPMADAVARRQIVLRQTLNTVDMVICPSNFLINKFAEYGFDTTRYLFIRQGLAAPDTAVLRSHWSGSDTLRLGYVGQMKVHKGVDLLIDAVVSLLKEGQNIALDLWGPETEKDGYLESLKRRTAEYPSIHWKGQYTGSQVWSALSAFDILVIPSRWYENSPNAILEAYKMGLPVIATDLGGMSELVEHEKSGLLFELNNADHLRCQIERLLKEPTLLNQLRSGIPKVKSLDEEMREIVEHYQRLVKDRSVHPS